MSAVNPIAPGFNSVNPYIIVQNSSEAIEFYTKAFGATERLRMPGPNGSTMHAELQFGDSVVMMTDECEEHGLKSAKTVGACTTSLHLCVENVDAAFARATAAGCEVVMPVTNMFWGDRFCKLVDPFGNQWSIATHVEDVSAEEMQRRHAEAMKQMESGGSCDDA